MTQLQIEETFLERITRQRGLFLVGVAGNVRPEPPEEGPGVLSAIGAGFQAGTTAQIIRSVRFGRGDFDPDFSISLLPKEVRRELMSGISEEFRGAIAEAVSFEDALQLKKRALEIQEAERTLSRLGGLSSFSARIAGVLIDPVEIAAFSLSGGVGVASKGLGVVSRVRALSRSGIAVGLTAGSLEAFAGQDDPNRDTGDVLLAGLFGFGIGGPIGLLQRRSASKFRQAQRTMRQATINDSKRVEFAALKELEEAGKLTILRSPYFADVAGRDANIKRILENMERLGYEGEDLDVIRRSIANGEFEGILSRMERGPQTANIGKQGVSEAKAVTLTEKNVASQVQAKQALVDLGFTESQAEARLIGDLVSRTDDPFVNEFVVRSLSADGTESVSRFGTKAEADIFAKQQTKAGKKVSQTQDSGVKIVPKEGDKATKLAPNDEPPPGTPPPGMPDKQAGDFSFEGLTPGTQQATHGRVSISAKATRLSGDPEKAPVAHMASQGYFNDPLPRKAGEKAILGADAATNSGIRRFLKPFFGEFERARTGWLKRNGFFILNIKQRNRFAEEVTDVVRRGILPTDDPDIVRAAKAFIKNQSENLGFAKRHGSKPFMAVPQDDLHVPRMWVIHKMSAVMRKIEDLGGDGTKAIQGFFIRAFRAANPDVEEELADKIGRGMFKTIMKSDDLTDIERSMVISGQRNDLLVAAIREEAPETTEKQIRAILKTIKPRKKDPGVLTSRGRRRVLLDESAEIVTPEGVVIRIADLTENNAVRLAELSTRQMVSAGVESELLRAISKQSGKQFDNFQQLRVQVEKEVLKTSGRRASKEVGRLLEIGHRSMRGIPLEADSLTNDVLRATRGVADVLFNGMFGVAAIPETARAIASGGWANFIRHLPELGQIFKAVRGGEINNQVLRELNATFHMNMNGSLSRILGRVDESTAILERNLSRGFSSEIESITRGGGALSNILNFNEPITMVGKNWSLLMMAQKMFDLSRGRGTLSASRRSLLGLSEADAELVMRELRTFAKSVEGPYGGGVKIGELNLHLWEPKAQVLFTTSLDREARRAIQSVSVGNLAPWMTKELGRTIFQYRTFGFVAYENHLLNSIAMRDAQVAVETITEGMFVALAYTAQTHALAIGRSDRKEFLEERMDPVRMASMIFQRSSVTSMLPDVLAATGGLGGFDGFMDDRITGLNRFQRGLTNPLMSNPSFRLIDSAFKTVGNVSESVFTDKRFTQTDFRSLADLVPLNRSFVVRNGLNLVQSKLPERR